MGDSNHKAMSDKGSIPLFTQYVVRLILRSILFVVAVAILALDPAQLNPSEYFGFAHGLSFIDVVFLFLILDCVTKFLPGVKIAMGSLKQYRTFHAPTKIGTTLNKDEVIGYIKVIRDDGVQIAGETIDGVRETAKHLADNIATRGIVPLTEANPAPLDGELQGEELRQDIRSRRLREIVPVIIFWIMLNALVALLLNTFGYLTPSVAVVWMLFYFLFDMICVVAWCPLQLALMRNRCCTTCQIFNWDAIMTATPLIFAPSLFSFIYIVLSIVVLVRWELAFVRHPERFDERTNASLSCANCNDKLCKIRNPLLG